MNQLLSHYYFENKTKDFNCVNSPYWQNKVFTLADRKTWVSKLISIYFYILISLAENYQNYSITE